MTTINFSKIRQHFPTGYLRYGNRHITVLFNEDKTQYVFLKYYEEFPEELSNTLSISYVTIAKSPNVDIGYYAGSGHAEQQKIISDFLSKNQRIILCRETWEHHTTHDILLARFQTLIEVKNIVRITPCPGLNCLRSLILDIRKLEETNEIFDL